jgi:hypothetical protein
MVSDIIHVCNLSIDVQFGNMFYCSILIRCRQNSQEFLDHSSLIMDDSKSETKEIMESGMYIATFSV